MSVNTTLRQDLCTFVHYVVGIRNQSNLKRKDTHAFQTLSNYTLKQQKSLFPHLTSPSYHHLEHTEYILHKIQRRVSHVSEPPLQGRWPCHRQDVACTSDRATQGPQSSFLHEALQHHTVLRQRTGRFQDPRGTFSPICKHTSAELWVPNFGTSEMGKLDKFCSLTKGSQQFVLPPRFKKKKLPPITTFIKGHFITQIKNIISE